MSKSIGKLMEELKQSKDMNERARGMSTRLSFLIDDAIKTIKGQQETIQSKDDEIKRLRSLLNICENDNKRLTEVVRYIESKLNEWRG